jgi:hypothetical protein
VKRFIVIVFIVLVKSSLNAQLDAIFSDNFPSEATTRVGVVANYDFNSNVLTNNLLSKFYTGGFIDENMKSSAYDKLKNKNRVGGNVNYGFYAAYKPDSISHKKYVSFFVSMRDRYHFDSQFSKDFFKLAFYGNAPFAGKTAYMNDFSLNYLHYQQLQLGIYSSNLDSVACWGMGLALLKGQDYLTVQAPRAELFTDEDGQYVDFNTQMQFAIADTATSGLGSVDGLGASLDFYFEAPFQTRFGSAKIKVSLADVGFIRFNKQTMVVEQDSTFRYSGVEINNLLNIQNNNQTTNIIDSIVKVDKKGFSANLPSVFSMMYESQLGSKFQLTEGMRYSFNSNYGLLAYLKGSYLVTPRFMVSATVGYGGYGGYGRFNYGLGIFANLKNGLVVYAGSNNLEGYIAPKTNAGQGVYISIAKNFK